MREACAAVMSCAAVIVIVSVGGAPAAAAEGAPMMGIVHDPCPAMVPRPAELDARTELYLKPEKFDPAADSAPLEPATQVYVKAQAELHERDWAGLCRFEADNAAALRGAPVRVVFLGDSITENWLPADPSLFTGGVVNRGISGQTSPQMLVRFYADIVALHPRVVHIMAGTNDLAGNTGPTSATQYENNIRAMCDLARANGIRVVLASIPPAAAFPWRPGLRPGPQITELNGWLRDYAAKQKFIYVDYTPALADANGAMRADLSHDGVHPHRAGYALMRPLAERAVAAAMAGR